MPTRPLDYSPLLPQELAPKLVDATATWRSASASQDAILLPLFTGIKVFRPDVFAVRNKFNMIGQAPIPLCQDISSYAQVLTSVIGSVEDRNTLATTLRDLVSRWHHLDPVGLTVTQAEVARLLHYDSAEVGSINIQLKKLSETISSYTPDSANALFSSSLFDAGAHILKTIADFPSTVDGVARFAGAVGLSIRAVNAPLKTVFHKPIVGRPVSSPEVVSQALNALADHIREYFANIDKVIADVDTLVRTLREAASRASLILKGIDDFAAGQSSENPVDSATVEKAWNEAGLASEGFISSIVGKSSAATSPGISPFAVHPNATIQPADVETVLGPPPSGARTLFTLADLTLRTTGQLGTVLALPYITDLRVKSAGSGAEVSLFEALLETKKSYEDIKSSTVPIMSSIQTYSLLHKNVLPILGSDLPVAGSEIFQQWAVLAASYGASSIKATAKCQALLKKLQMNVSALKSNLDEVKARIAADEDRLAAAQRDYDVTKAQILVEGILKTIFTTSTMTAIYAGKGPLAKELGAKAGGSLHRVIANNVEAGEIMRLIRKIEGIIATTDETSRQLETTLTLLVDGTAFTTQVDDVWAYIKRSLDVAVSNYTYWKDSGLLVTEPLRMLALRWQVLENTAIHNVDSVLGIKTSTTVNLFAMAHSEISDEDAKSMTFVGLSDKRSLALSSSYELNDDPHLRELIEPQTAKEHIKKLQVMQACMISDQFYNAIKAPYLNMSTNRQSLNHCTASYQLAAKIMQSLYPSDADDLRSLASRIDNDVIPSVTECVDFYKTFADRQVVALSVTPTKVGLEGLAAENSKYAEEGLKKAQAAQRKVLDSKNLSVLICDTIIMRSNELQRSMDIAERELSEKQDELDRYKGYGTWNPQIAVAIALVEQKMLPIRGKIISLQIQMWTLQLASAPVNAAFGVKKACHDTIVSLTQSWVNLTQEANNLSTYLTLFDKVPMIAPTLTENAKATWESLNKSLGQW